MNHRLDAYRYLAQEAIPGNDSWSGLKRTIVVIGMQASHLSRKIAAHRLDQIHDNAERTAALSPGDMLLARLVLNGHLTGGKKP